MDDIFNDASSEDEKLNRPTCNVFEKDVCEPKEQSAISCRPFNKTQAQTKFPIMVQKANKKNSHFGGWQQLRG